MSKRKVLENGANIELYVEEKDRRDAREFHITKLVSDGGASTIAYRAYHQNSSNIGILREYCPVKDDLVLDREEDGRIRLDMSEESEAERIAYLKGRERYLAPYLELRKIQREKENDDLASFIPYFEICYGCSDAEWDDGTVYIWTPAPQAKTFTSVCVDVHNNPTDEPEYKLYVILNAIISLTKCVGELHRIRPVGLIHRDIKPDNFGFAHRRGELLTQSISLFDVDSICKAYPFPEEDLGTPGFMENDNERRNDNLRDIYSIGATLFYAIIITEETKKSEYKYLDSYYKQIPELVKSSKLISSSDSNSFPRLRSYLSRILRKCLCSRYSPDGRYEDCESLAADLMAAVSYIVPMELSNSHVFEDKWVLQDARKMLGEKEKNNSKSALQYHLYKYPLYQIYRKADCPDSIKALFIGFGKYGFKHLDLVLESAQNLGVDIKVTVISDSVMTDDKSDEELYLEERSEVEKFFQIRGRKPVENSYGEIEFKTAHIVKRGDELGVDRESLKLIFSHGEPFDYIFIDLNNNVINRETANDIAVKNVNALINFVYEGHSNETLSVSDKVVPVMVSEDIHKDDGFSEIERMAFNAHLVWNENSSISYDTKKKEFQEEYNFTSCVSNVLAIKYKLWRLGIDLDEIDIYEAAKKTDDLLNNNPSKRRYLTWLEHRRWVTEKICDGWKTRTLSRCYELAGISDDVARDKAAKEHVCIVKGNPEWALENVNTKEWDAGRIDVTKLDDLDRVSVGMHRFYEEQSTKMEMDDFAIERNQLIDSGAFQCFEEWLELRNEIIQNGDRDIAALFKAHWLRLKDAIEADNSGELTAFQKKTIIKSMEQRIAPVLRRYEYKDYKKIDADLIDRLPYILTYTDKLNLIYPMEIFNPANLIDRMGVSSEFVFKHVAAAVVLNPETITYLYYVPERVGFDISADPGRIADIFKRIILFQKRKELRFRIKLVIFCHTEGTKFLYVLPELDRRDIDIEYCVLKKKESPGMAVSSFIESISNTGLPIIENTNAVADGWLSDSNVKEMLSNYSFDYKQKSFSEASGCEWVRYIRDKSFLSSRDIVVLSGRRYTFDENVDFGMEENTDLWKIYKSDSSRWKRCSKFLAEREHYYRTELVSCKKEDVLGGEIGTFRFYMPAKCHAALKCCLQAFLKDKLIGKESEVYYCSETVCCLKAKCTARMRDKIDYMLSIPHAFEDADELKITSIDSNKTFSIQYSDLIIKDIDLGAYIKKLAANNQISRAEGGKEKAEREIRGLLTKFHGKGIIHDLHTAGGKISFTYGSYTIKKLMENAGNMLEFRVYQELSGLQSDEVGRTHYFDNVVGGITFSDNSNSITEQIDCMVTKGFRSLIIECKAQDNLSQRQLGEYIEKLGDRVDKYGIASKGLLLIDSSEPIEVENDDPRVIIKRVDDITENGNDKIGRYVAGLMAQ